MDDEYTEVYYQRSLAHSALGHQAAADAGRAQALELDPDAEKEYNKGEEIRNARRASIESRGFNPLAEIFKKIKHNSVQPWYSIGEIKLARGATNERKEFQQVQLPWYLSEQ